MMVGDGLVMDHPYDGLIPSTGNSFPCGHLRADFSPSEPEQSPTSYAIKGTLIDKSLVITLPS